MVDDLHILPKFRDGLGFLYLEFGRLERDEASVKFVGRDEVIPIPASALAVLFLGPGTTVTHAAVCALVENGCSIVWTGMEGLRFYAHGLGETRKGARQLKQALLWAHPNARQEVIRRMYAMRFPDPLPDGLSLEQVRGKEGVRVREAYARASRESGVPWDGRKYERGDWDSADPINRALSTANACLNALCLAAILSSGYSPAIGFIHTGKMQSFVYDVADLYKAEVTVPVAFATIHDLPGAPEREVRRRCRAAFHEARLLSRIVPDIDRILDVPKHLADSTFDVDQAMPGWLWDEAGPVSGGQNHGGDDRGGRHGEPSWGTEPLDAGAQGGTVRGEDERNGEG